MRMVAMGLIINRPTRIMMQELLKSYWQIIPIIPSWLTTRLVYFGGPVQKRSGHGGAWWGWKNGKTRWRLPSKLFFNHFQRYLWNIRHRGRTPQIRSSTLGYAAWEKPSIGTRISKKTCWLTCTGKPHERCKNQKTPCRRTSGRRLPKFTGIDINLNV